MVKQLDEALATSWKVAGWIPDGVTGIFYRHNSSGSRGIPLLLL